ncbi:SAM-dependent methyltransferase [Microbacterium laevaniformans]|uniref:SAM-dependent methyltransferase n=1 Tax=Microbacterium laevaniformans TaxID=36807 RepID=A0A4S2DA15_9MICO|nr:SAM-dependent methyltransferase [Microbacterium laevaniformans]TGY37513.1 SAM-dependent methyltransferase [Microbacterium laevaniformans]
MGWPFLYFAGDRLSTAELSAARLDGDLVEVGEAYMPTDAVETRELRAGSLRPLMSAALALTRRSAAWVHGALAEPPVRHDVQRFSARRIHSVVDNRLVYRDVALRGEDVMAISGVAVTTPARTLADLVRDQCGGVDTAAEIAAVLRWSPGLASTAAQVLADGPPLHHKRAAIAVLRTCAQEEVAR